MNYEVRKGSKCVKFVELCVYFNKLLSTIGPNFNCTVYLLSR
jgi:hypothetical protein